MSEFILTILAIALIAISSYVARHIFNPLSVYTIVWYFSLLLATLNWVGFKKISAYCWLLIVLSYFAFALGFFTVVAIYKSIIRAQSRSAHFLCDFLDNTMNEKKGIEILIFVFCILAFIGVLYTWINILRNFGSFTSFLANGNLIYSERVRGSGPSSIPYLASFALAATSLVGIRIAWSGKFFSFLNIIPLCLVFLHDLALMGRTGIFMALGLFFTPFLVFFKIKKRQCGIKKRNVDYKKAVIIAMLLSFAAIRGANFVRVIRGGFEGYDIPMSGVLEFLHKIGLFIPSLYVYFAGPPVVLSEILHIDPMIMGRDYIPGMLTFAPFFRFLSKLGISPPVPFYGEFVDVGIGFMNAGTYLKEIYLDFGMLGIIIIPYLLGFISTFFFYRVRVFPNAFNLNVLNFLYLSIETSTYFNPFGVGTYVIGFTTSLLGILVMSVMDKRMKLNIR